jgi:hypothetical protein
VWRRPVVAGVLLLAVYVGLSFLNSPRGFLGTDTGGKVATLEVMTAGPGMTLDPDLGYWAEEWDPDGSVHPIYYNARYGERWVNVTTLPMLYAALPLYELGGYRAALLLPMFGSVAAAFAARSLSRRLGGDDDTAWLTYWVVGLASPMAVYALDFWEHSWGVALMTWAVVLLWDVVASLAGRWRLALVAGALFGLSFTMRTETLVYFGITGLAVTTVLIRRRASAMRLVSSGAAALLGFAVVAVAIEAVERAVLDRGIRSARASGIASLAGDAPDDRLTEAAYTLVGAAGSGRGVVIGAAAVALFAYGIVRSAGDRGDVRFAQVVLAGAAVVFALRYADGSLGFVPGLFVAWPLAGAAVVLGALRRSWPAVVGAGALPVVLATQFRGGAAPQWAGRYVLVSGLLLTIAGAVLVARPSASVPVAVRRAAVGACAVVTALGLAWLSVRSHDVDRTIAAINARPEPVVVSAIAHLAREGGATYGDMRWLTAVDVDLRQEAADVVRATGLDRFVLVELAASPSTDGPEGWRRTGSDDTIELFDDVDLRLTSWVRTGSR